MKGGCTTCRTPATAATALVQNPKKYVESEYEMLHIDILPKPNFPSGDKKDHPI